MNMVRTYTNKYILFYNIFDWCSMKHCISAQKMETVYLSETLVYRLLTSQHGFNSTEDKHQQRRNTKE
jgi:hypothetical protein